MAKAQTTEKASSRAVDQATGQAELRSSPMMAHLLDALNAGTDIGEYGRLTFVMVARFFLEEDELITALADQPGLDEKTARSLLLQVQERDYNPPQRRKIMEWQEQQEFPICPNPEDPNGCNVYRELQFPPNVYEHVQEFYEERAAEE